MATSIYSGLRLKPTHSDLTHQLGRDRPELVGPLRSFELLKLKLDAHKSKGKSIALRKDWIVAQKRANYQNEYDRIRGLLSQTILPDGAKRLREREAELKRLGIKGPSIMV